LKKIKQKNTTKQNKASNRQCSYALLLNSHLLPENQKAVLSNFKDPQPVDLTQDSPCLHKTQALTIQASEILSPKGPKEKKKKKKSR
jgi:hypothetical protein